jgi:hypothetical protein
VVTLSSQPVDQSCRDPLSSELYAIMEGLSLSLNWCNLPIMVETDSLEIVKMLRSEGVNRSVHAPMVEETNYARTSSRTVLWLCSG